MQIRWRHLNHMHKKPQLLVLTSTYPRWSNDPEPGFVHELSRRLTDTFEVTVICPAAPGAAAREHSNGVLVRRFRYAPRNMQTLVNDGGIVTNLKAAPWKWLLVPLFLIAEFWAVWKVTKEIKPDVVHAHWLIPQGIVIALFSILPIGAPPFLVTSHGTDLNSLRSSPMRMLKRFVARRSAGMTVVSSGMLDQLEEQDIFPPIVSVEPMGVDLAGRFTPDKMVRRSVRELLFVGRLVQVKGLSTLLEALPIVVREFEDVCLTVAGSGPEKESLKRQADSLGVLDRVKFLGAIAQSDLPALYQRATLCIAPFVPGPDGAQEGFGLVVVEAMGCGCPVVVSRTPAIEVIIPDETKGLIVEPGSVNALARGIAQLLADERRRAELSINGRRHALENFDWNRVGKRYSRLLGEIAGREKPC